MADVNQIMQSEMREYARLDQQIEELSEKKEELRLAMFAKAEGAAAVNQVVSMEPGDLRVKISIGTKVGNVEWKAVMATITAKNCTFINGGGKIAQLNPMLKSVQEMNRGDDVPNNRLSVKPNVK